MRKVNECKVLHVNLTDNSHYVEKFGEEYMKKYLGGRGITSFILYRDVPRGADPYGPDNIVAFAPGTLAGTNAPTAGRTTITGKSPATGLFMKANAGGHWGAELKYTGYDALIVHGNSNEWINLIITNNEIRFEPAECYLGLSVKETTERIQEDHKNMPGIAVSCIGQSGENLVKYAGVFCSVHHAAGRGGLGAVMGAKKLKAVSCFGRDGIPMYDTKRFLAVVKHSQQMINNNGRCNYNYKKYGSGGGIINTNSNKCMPVRNFQANYLDKYRVYNISGVALVTQGYLLRRVSCFGCTVSCHRYSKTVKKYPGIETGGPELETFSAFGAGCMLDIDDIVNAHYLTNLYGLDLISTASVIQWAMETAEHGLLPKKFTDPATGKEYNLEFGNAEAVMVLIEMITFRRGLGDLLADGVKIAAERVGGESWKWAIQVKGLEQSRVDTRNSKDWALAFATNPRGPDHLYGLPSAERGPSAGKFSSFSPERRAIVKKITGDEKYAATTSIEGKPEIVAWHEDVFFMVDSLGLCMRVTLCTYCILPSDMAKMFEAQTGIKMSEEDMFEAAHRVINLERFFNMREGVRRESDTLPWRLMNEPVQSLTNGDEMVMNSADELNIMLDQYYNIREWDETGLPLRETIKKYGLDTIIEERDYKHNY